MTIVTKTVDGYGPYAYRAEYQDPETQNWTYLGRLVRSTRQYLPTTRSQNSETKPCCRCFEIQPTPSSPAE